ncbi:methyltransferase domain-containing protein [Oceanithermus desulfurans]
MPRSPTPAPDPWRFFALALGLSWAFWAPVALAGWNIWSWPAVGLGALGLFGPALAEAVLVGRARDHALRHDYLQRLVDLRRIPPGVWAVLVLGFPLINALAMLWGAALGQPWPAFETARALLEAPWRLLPFAAFVLLFGPLPEELGWRGYALDGLQARFSALTASLLLGLVWAGWHLPLFFMPGTYQHDRLGLATPGFWAFVLGTVVTSVLFTWVYNRANRSTLAAVLFHFSINFSGELFALPEPTQVFRTVLVALWAAAVVVVEGPRTLRDGASWARFLGRGAFAPDFAFVLLSPLRRLVLSPSRLAERLHLREDSRVLELGPGPGYFSVEVARRIPRGRLELLDLQPRMLELARRRLARAGLESRAGFTVADAGGVLPWDDGAFDVVFLVAVLGELPDPLHSLREVRRVLRPGGWLSVTEQPGDPDFVPAERVRELAAAAGFEPRESYGSARNFTLNFVRPG